MAGAAPRVAVVLFNLGAPDDPGSVRPFLFNRFSDPAVLPLPGLIRWPLAWALARSRTRKAQADHDRIGGGSPLLENTQAQAVALEAALDGLDARVFIAMRYWHPMADETAEQVADFGPDQILLLPLYPQYSATSTASSVRIWRQSARTCRLSAPTRLLCCFPVMHGFIGACASLIGPALRRAAAAGQPRLLFSARGLPERTVEAGDPYQVQCTATAGAIVDRLAIDDLDWVVCYRSPVAPLKGIGPSTDAEIARAGGDAVPVVVFPLSCLSEHAGTLVDIEVRYRAQALACGVPHFERVAAVGTHPDLIAGLAGLVRSAMKNPSEGVANADGGRNCPDACSGCPWPRKDA